AAPDGSDRGPFQYEKNIFYVRTDGNDQGDGLSVSNAWKTLSRAMRGLRSGNTLYIAPGVYEGNLELRLKGSEGKLINIRGRGRDPVVIKGGLVVKDGRYLDFKRLHFNGEVSLINGEDIGFENCQFNGRLFGLQADKVAGLRVTHCEFTGFEESGLLIGLRPGQKSWWTKLKEAVIANNKQEKASTTSRVYLSGNLFDNRKGVAVRLDGTGAVEYSNYNSYCNKTTGWEVGGIRKIFAEMAKNHDQQSRELVPEYVDEKGVKILKNTALFAAGGALGKPFGLFRDEKRHGQVLGLAEKPIVHSVSATTANIEWMTTLPATCELVWGETPSYNNTNLFVVNYFGSYSLSGLKPGKKYYFRIKSLRIPRKSVYVPQTKSIEIIGKGISFVTLKKNSAPLVYYVAPDGKDTNTGLDRKNAWKTIRHAAGKVNVGDKVLVAGGKYQERVRIRATGETNAPITFKCIPGEKVVMDGVGKGLSQSFVVAGKKRLHFDGLYFRDFSMASSLGIYPACAGEFNLYSCQDIAITRCFSDGRGGYTAGSVSAFYVKNLLIKNCVNINKMGGAMYFWRCPDLRVENTVFASPMISSFIHRNEKHQKALMENCIFTDMFLKKAALNIGLLCCDGHIDSFLMRNDCFFLRDCIPLEKRALNGKATIGQLGKYIIDPVFADPLFAGDPVVAGLSTNTANFPPDRMMPLANPLDFNSYFATNPELVKRGIGLQPEAFKDFNFSTPSK
ncbi:hypothetical protein ACFLQL_03555, partial [Verrucomicrobiota bacterium]